MPNNIKTADAKETKKLSHILTWILRRMKKKKLKSLKKVLSGILGNFGRRSKHYYPLLFYLSSDFKKLWLELTLNGLFHYAT